MQKAREGSLENRIARAVEEITATMKPSDRRKVAEAIKLMTSGWDYVDKICPGMSAIIAMAMVEATRLGFEFSKLTVDRSPAGRRRAEKLLQSHAAGTAGNIAKGNRTKSRVEEAFRAATTAGTDVNVEAIAAELGVSVGTVYRHLRNVK
jgi:DNA-binding NarL/FixJ family response regulator